MLQKASGHRVLISLVNILYTVYKNIYIYTVQYIPHVIFASGY
jgi:hypothetical protein